MRGQKSERNKGCFLYENRTTEKQTCITNENETDENSERQIVAENR